MGLGYLTIGRHMPSDNDRVVVTGMGAICCLGQGVDVMWDSLLAGRCGIGPLTRLNPDLHRVRHAGEAPLPEGPSSPTDPALQFLLAAGREALAQAGFDPARGRPARVGLALGTNFGAMAATERLMRGELPGVALPGEVTREVTRRLDLAGPLSAISLSCASGNAAIGWALDAVRSRRADAVLAGGYDAISEIVWAGLSSLRAMSPNALRPFDRRRDGTIFSEGAGLLLIERESAARARGALPLALVMGSATSNNAFHMTHPDAHGEGMVLAMRAALADAGLAPEAVDHINAHATGTPPNDRLETAAIKQLLGPRAKNVPVNGIKSMLGHAMGAASALEAIATVMTLRRGVIPPTLGLTEPDPDCDLDYVPLRARPADLHVALNNAAGFGGCNATLVLGRWEGPP
jgi:3-oxoacyl-[acyl-carrier-protein] synthase II